MRLKKDTSYIDESFFFENLLSIYLFIWRRRRQSYWNRILNARGKVKVKIGQVERVNTSKDEDQTLCQWISLVSIENEIKRHIKKVKKKELVCQNRVLFDGQ